MPLERYCRRFATLDRWQQWTLVVWVLVVLSVCGRVVARPASSTVYPIFADAARNWIASADLYQPSMEPYRYSPFVTVALVPFSVLPDQIGGVVWRILNVAVYVGGLMWFSKAVLPRSLTGRQCALLFLMVLPLSTGNLNNGQSNTLVLGLLLAGMAGVARQRWNLASVCIALACLFKVYPIAVGLLLVALFPRRFAVRLVVALVIGLALPYFFQEPAYVTRQYADWVHHLQTDDRQVLAMELWYRDLRLLCARCGICLTIPIYVGIQLIAAAGCAVLCLAVQRGNWSQRRLLTMLFGLSCCWMTLFGSAAESATYILLAPSVVWAVMEVWLECRPRGIRALLLCSYGLLIVSQMVIWFPAGKVFLSLGPQPLAALLLFVVMIAQACHTIRVYPLQRVSIRL